MEFISNKARLALLLWIWGELGFVHAHTRTNQFFPVCWGGFSYSIWSQRFHLSHLDPFGLLSAVALPASFLCQLPARKILPLTALPFQHTLHRKQKPTQACLCSWDLSARTHTCRSSMGTQQSVGSTRALVGVQGSRRSRDEIFFYHYYFFIIIVCFLERKRKKDYSSFSIKWKD